MGTGAFQPSYFYVFEVISDSLFSYDIHRSEPLSSLIFRNAAVGSGFLCIGSTYSTFMCKCYEVYSY